VISTAQNETKATTHQNQNPRRIKKEKRENQTKSTTTTAKSIYVRPNENTMNNISRISMPNIHQLLAQAPSYQPTEKDEKTAPFLR
jgi:hypothetical protein